MAETQKQNSGDNSVNIQAGQVVVGANYGEIRQIARDVFDANFYRLAQVAKETATQRAEALTESFLQQLVKTQTNVANSANDPDFQYALFTAQKEYARSGEKDLGEVLVDILVDRAKENGKSLKQIVLNESLVTTSKLIPSQWDALTILFLIKYVRLGGLINLDSIKQKILHFYVPFVENLPTNRSSYQHMEYAGCGTLGLGSVNIEKAWRENFPGLFSKGFTEETLKQVTEGDNVNNLLIKCLQDPMKLQFNAIDNSVLENSLKVTNLSEEKIQKMIALHKSHLMNEGEVKNYLLSVHPSMTKLFEVWNKSQMDHFTLTSVGIAIAHANLRRKTKASFDLGIWIN